MEWIKTHTIEISSGESQRPVGRFDQDIRQDRKGRPGADNVLYLLETV